MEAGGPKRWRTRGTAMGLALVIGVGGACSGSDGGGDGRAAQNQPGGEGVPARGPVDDERACRLLTKAEVETAMGAPVKEPVSVAGAEACSFGLVSGPGQVLVLSSESADNPAKFDTYSRGSARPVETLAGVGDRAFLVGGQAYVLKGSVLVGIAVDMRQAEARQNEVARRLVQLAAGRI